MHSLVACSDDLIFHFLLSVTNQRYEINISPESIIIGNDAIFKCSIPSFVSDFVSVESWIDSEANSLGSSFLGKNSCWNIFSVNSIKDIYFSKSHLPLTFQFQVSDTRLTSCARALLSATTPSLNARYQALCRTLSVLIHGLILKQIISDPPH